MIINSNVAFVYLIDRILKDFFETTNCAVVLREIHMWQSRAVARPSTVGGGNRKFFKLIIKLILN